MISNFPNSTFAIIPLNVLAPKSRRASQAIPSCGRLVQADFRSWIERAQNVTQVDCIFGVPIEVRACRQTDCTHFVCHRAVSQDG